MKENIFEVNREEKNRIIEMHINATDNSYLETKKLIKKNIEETLLFANKNKNTLNEAPIPKGWEKFSCVPNHPKAKKISDTAYTIEAPFFIEGSVTPINSAVYRNDGTKIYKKGNTSLDTIEETTYKCNEPPFTKQTPSKSNVPNATFDPKCGNVRNLEYDNYYKKCYLSKERQKTLFAGEKGFEVNWFPVKDENEWYQMYSLLKAEKIETLIAEMWGFYGGACKGGESAVGLNFPQTRDGKKYNLMDAIKWNMGETTPDKKIPRTEYMFRICYNDNIVTQKPYSNRGKYTGYKPTYADVINAYGPITVQEYGKKIYQAEGALKNEDSQGNSKLNIKSTTGLESVGDISKKVGEFIEGKFTTMDVDVLVNLISLCFDYAGLPEISMFIDVIHGFSYFYRAYYLEYGSPEWIADVLLGCLEIALAFFPGVGNIQMITVTKFIEEAVKKGIAKEAKNLVVFLYKIIKHYNGSSTPTSTGKVITNIINEITELKQFILQHPYNFPAILLQSIDAILDIIGGSLNFSDSDWEEIDRIIMQTGGQENEVKISPNVKIAPDKLPIDNSKI